MNYKILIVEDDRGIAEGIAEQMTQWGFEAKPVSDFHNVMGEFAEVQPHLVPAEGRQLLQGHLPQDHGRNLLVSRRASSAGSV